MCSVHNRLGQDHYARCAPRPKSPECPPCRSFTGQLAQTYAALHDRGLNFEVVFVSVDRSQESYNEYYKSMPWLALPLADERVQQLTRHFSVQGIPTLILLDEKNDLITTNGRTVVMKDPEGKEFPWPPKPLDQLNEVTANLLNESTCFVMFTGKYSSNKKTTGGNVL
ncbi:Nucleoredoxin [Lamellibrachia satsuma]|nr:Nucleoredoxin [Lamellibrachia satsuma]